MAYPENSFPTDPDFPNVSIYADFDENMYSVITSYITDMAAAMAAISDNAGNISVAASDVVKWGGTARITYTSSKVTVANLHIGGSWSYGTMSVSDDATFDDATIGGSATLTLSGNLAVTGVIYRQHIPDNSSLTLAQIAEPGDPSSGKAIIWNSNGTGTGDAGDLMIKVDFGGTPKTKTLVDFSTS